MAAAHGRKLALIRRRASLEKGQTYTGEDELGRHDEGPCTRERMVDGETNEGGVGGRGRGGGLRRGIYQVDARWSQNPLRLPCTCIFLP